MSDFDGVDFFENAEQMESKGPEVAPTGEYEAKIIAAEKYKSNSGNWRQFEDNWTNNEGQAVTSLKTKIIKMEPSEKKPAAPGEKPPF
jgi:hypothetical protein